MSTPTTVLRPTRKAVPADGCSRTGACLRVTLPLLAPGLVATGVFGIVQGRMTGGLVSGAVKG